MAITYRGAGPAAFNSTSATSLDVPYPGFSIAAGDIIVLVVGCGNSTAPTNPFGSGFTSRLTSNSGGSSPAFRISTRVATGSETGSVTVTTPNSQSQGRMFVFGDVDQSNLIDVAGTTFSSSTGVSAYDIPSVTTTQPGVALVVVGIANSASGTWTPPTDPANFFEVWDSNAATPVSTTAYLIWSGSGATGTINLVKSGSVRGCAGVIALRPATANVAAPDATATGSAGVPVVSGGADIVAPAAGATGGAGVPTIQVPVEVDAPAATAEGDAAAPTLSAGANIEAPAASAVGSAAAPTFPQGIVAPPAAGATGSCEAPTVSGGVNIGAPAAAATADAGTPTVELAVIVLAAAGVATASATAPELSAGANLQAVAALATGSAGVPFISSQVNDITISAALAPRGWTAATRRLWEASL